MSEDLIRYDILTQEALRRVIRRVLEEVERAGLPGEHHFFITFDTRFPGVKLSKRMVERYPEEMTIVVQHSFWNLETSESAFEIDLSFDDIRERLRVPYDSIRGFFDPSVKFGLQFDAVSEAANADSAAGETKGASLPQATPAEVLPAKAGKKKKQDKGKKIAAAETGDTDSADQPGDTADVVSLDSFRKKK